MLSIVIYVVAPKRRVVAVTIIDNWKKQKRSSCQNSDCCLSTPSGKKFYENRSCLFDCTQCLFLDFFFYLFDGQMNIMGYPGFILLMFGGKESISIKGQEVIYSMGLALK